MTSRSLRPYGQRPANLFYDVEQRRAAQPCGSRDGRELFYVDGGTSVAVSVSTGPSFSVGSVPRLFEHASLRAGLTCPRHDVSPDGRRFILAEQVGPEALEPSIRAVENWFPEFRNRQKEEVRLNGRRV